jgi:hypothetical protein
MDGWGIDRPTNQPINQLTQGTKESNQQGRIHSRHRLHRVDHRRMHPSLSILPIMDGPSSSIMTILYNRAYTLRTSHRCIPIHRSLSIHPFPSITIHQSLPIHPYYPIIPITIHLSTTPTHRSLSMHLFPSISVHPSMHPFPPIPIHQATIQLTIHLTINASLSVNR